MQMRERERLESEICVWSPMTEEAVRPRAFERYSSAITAYRGWSCDRAEGKERASEEMESLRDADVTLDLGEQTCVLTNVSRDNLQPSVSLSLFLSFRLSVALRHPPLLFGGPSTQIPLSDNLDLRQTPRPARKPLPTSDNIDSIQRNLLSHSRSSCPFDSVAGLRNRGFLVERSLLTPCTYPEASRLRSAILTALTV